MREKGAELKEGRNISLEDQDQAIVQAEGAREQQEGPVQERVDHHVD